MIIAYTSDQVHHDNYSSHVQKELANGMKLIVKLDEDDGLCYHSKDADSIMILHGKAVSANPAVSALESIAKAVSGDIDIESAAWGHYCFIRLSLTDNIITLDRTVHSNIDIYYCCSGRFTVITDNIADMVRLTNTEPNCDVIPEFLLYRELLGPDTLLKNVSRLMPRQRLIINNNKIISAQTRSFSKAVTFCAEPELVQSVRACFIDYFESDIKQFGRITNSLSGGQDSSLTQNLALAVENYAPRDVYSVSLRIANYPERNEDDYALSAAQEFGCTPHPVPVFDDEVINLVDCAISSSGYPLSHLQSAWFAKMASAIKERYDYCYCSEGADSLFGTQYMLDLYRLEMLFRKNISTNPLKYLKRIPVLKGLYSLYELGKTIHDHGSIHEVINQSGYITDYDAVCRWYGKERLDCLTKRRRQLLNQYIPENASLATTFSIGRTIAAVAPTIPKWNMISRSKGVNFLFPFANSRLFDLIISAPENIRLSLFKTKPLVKQLLGNRSRILVTRQKKSFGVPLNYFLFDENFYGSRWKSLRTAGLLPASAISDISVRRANDHVMWAIMGLEIWHNRFATSSLKENSNV